MQFVKKEDYATEEQKARLRIVMEKIGFKEEYLTKPIEKLTKMEISILINRLERYDRPTINFNRNSNTNFKPNSSYNYAYNKKINRYYKKKNRAWEWRNKYGFEKRNTKIKANRFDYTY